MEKEEMVNSGAAEEMAKLYHEVKKNNSATTPEEVHHLNVFFSGLLFCFFAEATGIFRPSQFTRALQQHTREDGSNLSSFLEQLFVVLHTPENKRAATPAYLAAFPFVQVGLFGHRGVVPAFSPRSREALMRCAQLNWRIIHPDIFGAMIQAVITPEYRGNLGIHYTSTANIHKVIGPLFLEKLIREFHEAANDTARLHQLLRRIREIRIFDPACGSGNFLITAYKALRQLEAEILRYPGMTGRSQVSLHHCYGIELDGFAAEIARLALGLAALQLNEEQDEPGARSFIQPANIITGNATRLCWEEVCPTAKHTEVYVLGNPPYIGARMLNKAQQQDRKTVFEATVDGYNDLDYSACWFYKGAQYISGHRAACAFVATSSICQGTQVAALWPHILKDGKEISFAYPSFKWTNNAKANAAVIVVIAGIRNCSHQPKYLFQKNNPSVVTNISPYLIEGNNIFVQARRTQLCHMPPMNFGSMPNDGGHLSLSAEAWQTISQQFPQALKFIKKLTGSREFINDIRRWCIWIEDDALEEALQFDFIKERLHKVKAHRLQSSRNATKSLAEQSHRFAEVRFKSTNAIIVPATSSERRHYLPIGFLDENTVINNSAHAIYDAAPWIFAVITSRMHMCWLRAVGGRLKSDYRYSSALCYNTFPFPDISIAQQQQLESCTHRILDARKQYADKTLAQLYDREKMPAALKEAHHQLDIAIEQCYRDKPFESDEARLAYLFNAYEKRT